MFYNRNGLYNTFKLSPSIFYQYEFYSYKLLAFSSDRTRVIIERTNPGGSNPYGRCGGALDRTLYTFNFEENGDFINYSEYIIESCLGNITADIISDKKRKIEYKIHNLDSESTSKIFVDLNLVRIQTI